MNSGERQTGKLGRSNDVKDGGSWGCHSPRSPAAATGSWFQLNGWTPRLVANLTQRWFQVATMGQVAHGCLLLILCASPSTAAREGEK